MKHLKRVLLIALVVVFANNVNAQDKDNRWVIELGANAVDFYPTGADTDSGPVATPFDGTAAMATGGFGEDFFNTDHWNAASALSSLRVGYYVGSGFSIGLTGSYNKISKIGDISVTEHDLYGCRS